MCKIFFKNAVPDLLPAFEPCNTPDTLADSLDS